LQIADFRLQIGTADCKSAATSEARVSICNLQSAIYNLQSHDMAYRSLQECIADLERTGQLVRIDEEIDAHLEAAEIQRRVYQAGGPAILFTRIKNCRFPMVSNLFGTMSRVRFLFRDTLDAVRHLVELKIDLAGFWKKSWRYGDVPPSLSHMRPRWVGYGPVRGRFRHPAAGVHGRRRPSGLAPLESRHVSCADLGGRYVPDREVGLHYQRGIGATRLRSAVAYWMVIVCRSERQSACAQPRYRQWRAPLAERSKGCMILRVSPLFNVVSGDSRCFGYWVMAYWLRASHLPLWGFGPTGIRLLAPHSTFLRAICTFPIAPHASRVPWYSILKTG
jgi:hypothetical protein